MLKLIRSMAHLDVEQLLSVYAESNAKSGQLRKGEDTFLSYLREDFFTEKDTVYAVWSDGNAYLSALRLEPYKDGFLIAGLETAPNVRRQGYAFSLLSGVIAHLRESGCGAVYSHVKKNNTVSISIHRKSGFQTISDTATLLDGTVTTAYTTMCYRI